MTARIKRLILIIAMDELREKLKIFMAHYDLTIKDIAKRINRTPWTVWRFLNNKTKPHLRTEYKIRELVGETDLSKKS